MKMFTCYYLYTFFVKIDRFLLRLWKLLGKPKNDFYKILTRIFYQKALYPETPILLLLSEKMYLYIILYIIENKFKKHTSL